MDILDEVSGPKHLRKITKISGTKNVGLAENKKRFGGQVEITLYFPQD